MRINKFFLFSIFFAALALIDQQFSLYLVSSSAWAQSGLRRGHQRTQGTQQMTLEEFLQARANCQGIERYGLDQRQQQICAQIGCVLPDDETIKHKLFNCPTTRDASERTRYRCHNQTVFHMESERRAQDCRSVGCTSPTSDNIKHPRFTCPGVSMPSAPSQNTEQAGSSASAE